MIIFFRPFRSFCCIALLCMCALFAQAQNNGLLQRNDLSDSYRIIQLTDSAKARQYSIRRSSFVVRPVHPPYLDADRPKNYISLDNVGVTLNYNDSLGAGYNNESLYQATGWQSRYTLGIKAAIGNVQVDFQPEWIVAQNLRQATIPDSYYQPANGDFFSRYYYMNINVIDMPSRYGTAAINKFFWGQSSLRYSFNAFSLGISNENIWWGPGMRNSLVMTNNARGFAHITFNTTRPVETGVGSFEGQFIYGKLDSSGVEPVENVPQQAIWPGAYVPKEGHLSRNIAAMIVSWQPKWLPNFHVGFAASAYFYTDPPTEVYPYSFSTYRNKTAAMGSIFFRYAMPAEQAEVYIELGRSDRIATPFNLIGDTIPLGYTAGARKLIPLRKQGAFIELVAEVTRLQLTQPQLIFNLGNPVSIPKTNSWYTHPWVRQGYTQDGQLLGAGIGPGSNSQTVTVSWIDGFNKLGLHVERVIHNEDFFNYQYLSPTIGVGSHNKHWTDLAWGLHGQAEYKSLLFAASFTVTSALNYRWVKADGAFDGPSSLSDKKNTGLTFSVMYRFNKRQFLRKLL